MHAFKTRDLIVEDYKNYLNSFTLIKNIRIREKVDEAFKTGKFLPEPLIQFNPSFKLGESLDDLESENLIDPRLKIIFGTYNLYHHQVEAIRKGVNNESFVVTSGTGSGKSLTYLATIFNNILKSGEKKGTKAILVYPMNALINSQEEEIKKYEINYLKSFLIGRTIIEKDKSLDDIITELKRITGQHFPITYGKYTGQEKSDQKEAEKNREPNIILTNYMMLELIMTRSSEKWLRDSMQQSMQFMVFDELHTYRGRQGSDVSMLIRRIKNQCKKELVCIGTSATMATGGTVLERKEAVAKVAQDIFGMHFNSENIIGEKLATCSDFSGTLPGHFELQEAIVAKPSIYDAVDSFRRNALAIWLENKIALKLNENGEPERGEPETMLQITELLSEDSGESPEVCMDALMNLLQWCEELNLKGSKLVPQKSYLPYKIHQFVSQTGNVYVTLDEKNKREITLDTGRYIRTDGEDLSIYPVLFSRYSGYDFICVRKDGQKLIPRMPDDLPEKITRDDLKGDKETGLERRLLSEDDYPDGYILLPEVGDEIWSPEDEDYLPETWLDNRKKKLTKFDNYYQYRLPQRVYFDVSGNYSSENKYPISGWFIAARLLFDPTSGVIFDQKTNENTKLMRLGNEGRSTATTITSFSILKAMNRQQVPIINQKLLSFTDNRQDASLQSGHFNDFLMLGRLRSAIYYALKEAPANTLNIDTISDQVFRKINLKEDEYARIPSSDPSWPDPENEKAIKDYIQLRILYDLKRGWRYNTPNLEQCALLKIEYNRLKEVCDDDSFFSRIQLFDNLSPSERHECLSQILDFFRTSYAFEYYKINENLTETEERLRNRLHPEKLWSLDQDEKIDIPYVMLPRSVGETNRRVFTASVGPMSYMGRYLKRLFRDHALDPLSGAEQSDYMDFLFTKLEGRHFLKSEIVKGKGSGGFMEAKGYRLRIDSVLWKLGDGITITPDKVRIATYRELDIRPNDFFRKFYQQDFNSFQRTLLGREHTGQLSNDDRIDREDRFRKGKIAALFCSPTMELGIDIKELNVVHMRNVPPNPANYAQRSGRAGRSGQAALVFTYCSNGSPHDRNYFLESKKMVSGKVAPPKIDLSNEELLLTHLNAFIMMELGLQNLHSSVAELMAMTDLPGLPLKSDIILHIKDQTTEYGNDWMMRFNALIEDMPEVKNSLWFSDSWLFTRVQSFQQRFNASLDRWRILFLNASRMIDKSRSVIDDPTIAADNSIKRRAVRDERIGHRQKSLLMNDGNRSFGSESEFYVFRYLASEGFLPGYNFTRLPIRAFLGYRHMDKGEFVSRPRFVALKEFGPNNLIYHNGGKFLINRMQIANTEVLNHSIKISTKTGYAFLDEHGKGVNNDPITGDELKGQDMVAIHNNLMELGECDAKPQERISCEEEERTSRGFEIDQYFSFPKGIEETKKLTVLEGSDPLLQIIYAQSASLIQINRRWRTSKKEEGFNIGQNSGRWLKEKDASNPDSEDKPMNVRLYTTGTADVLYIQPVKELGLDESGVISLAYALKRAIEKEFQVEEGEIGVWIMGQKESRNIMIYEAAEGSLGVLSQLVTPSRLSEIFKRAYEICHFEVNTRTDIAPDLPKATYDDLLSYFNQRHHDVLDRKAIKTALEKLMDSQLEGSVSGVSYSDKYQELLQRYDLNSSTEKKFIEYLFKHGLALPDKAQFNVPGCYANADFVYKTQIGFSLIFCDGSVHDEAHVKDGDSAKRECCRDSGYDVVEWHYTESLDALVERRKDIFRKVN
jgi:superfamily II DNA or RNA helicase